ncbi:MAG: Gfo/Idh/MocA family oxidoreductase [Nitrososphaerota archaeon]|nr:Gfo/Idh/MocA family oxidoreductase [Candidatus Calditenuaceae archaeon]MDW8073741.1 Gfo/Idh/MocA family oxidoreductase [Nitrososphaerota archaeon]
MVREIGVGMLGYAFMGKAHTNAFIKMPRMMQSVPAVPKLVAIYGRTLEQVKAAAERYGYKRYYTDWGQLVRDPEVELVDNGLPNNLHKDPCIEAAERGRHVICEKPMALNSREAEEMYRAVERAGVKHMVAFNYRFVPAVVLARRLIQEGVIGKVLQFRGTYLQDWIMDPSFPLMWRLRREVAGSGALGDLGAHVFDLARYLVGEVEAVMGLAKTFVEERPLPENPTQRGKVTVDDAFISLVKFRNGAIGSVEATRFGAGCKNLLRFDVHGTEGTLVFNLERLNELELFERKDTAETQGYRRILVTDPLHPYIANWWPPGHIIGWEHTFVHEIHHFIDCIVNDKPVAPMGATFLDGLKNNQILDAVLRSAETGRWERIP